MRIFAARRESIDHRQRDLQLEARAHIAVQEWIGGRGISGRATTTAAICEIHGRFGELLPSSLLTVENPHTGERTAVRPGELRHHDIRVGRHIAVSPGAVPRFLSRFEQAYGRLGRADTILASAAAAKWLAS